jgi:hypothetical protein
MVAERTQEARPDLAVVPATKRPGRPRQAACKYGHPFTPENTYTKPNGMRQCRTCRQASYARYQERRWAEAPERRGRRANERKTFVWRLDALPPVELPQDTAPVPIAAVEALQRPLSLFEQIALEQMRRQQEAKAMPRSSFADLVKRGEEERDRRTRRELAAIGGAAGGVTAQRVIAVVAGYYGISVKDLKGKKRDVEFTYPRQVAMYLLRDRLKISLGKIGEYLGGRDHTTVMHGATKIERELAEGRPALSCELVEIVRELRALLVEGATA